MVISSREEFLDRLGLERQLLNEFVSMAPTSATEEGVDLGGPDPAGACGQAAGASDAR